MPLRPPSIAARPTQLRRATVGLSPPQEGSCPLPSMVSPGLSAGAESSLHRLDKGVVPQKRQRGHNCQSPRVAAACLHRLLNDDGFDPHQPAHDACMHAM